MTLADSRIVDDAPWRATAAACSAMSRTRCHLLRLTHLGESPAGGPSGWSRQLRRGAGVRRQLAFLRAALRGSRYVDGYLEH